MKDFRIALVQINVPQSNTVEQNIEKMRSWIRKAADRGADIVMFGELSVSGYLLDSAGLRAPDSGSSEHYRRAEAVPGAATRKLETLAKEYGLFIAAGMGDLQAGVVYNAYFMVGPDGYVGKQRKIHMPDVEYPLYGTGSLLSKMSHAKTPRTPRKAERKRNVSARNRERGQRNSRSAVERPFLNPSLRGLCVLA